MKPELLASIKDIMGLSGVSERTAKRRMAAIRKHSRNVDLHRYCAWYKVAHRVALEYVLSKRYDPLHLTRLKRVEHDLYAYEIRTWEERYASADRVSSIGFQEVVLYDAASTVKGRVRSYLLPLEFLTWHEELSLEAVSCFVRRALPVDAKAQLLEFYGLMVMKRKVPRKLGFVLEVEVHQGQLSTLSKVLRRELKDKQALWFCQTEVVDEAQREELGFWEIKGTGHAISGLPGYDRKGKVRVWVV
jgi:hypothetical protein